MSERLLPERSHLRLAPPLRGSRNGEADPRGVTERSADATFALDEPPSLSLPRKGGVENEPRVPCTFQQAFVAAASALRAAGIETPELDARLLLCHAAGLSHEAYIARTHEALTPEIAARLDGSIRRRAGHEPVSRITGRREFYGRSFMVGPSVLDPRPDTETLIEVALDLAAANGGGDRVRELLDLGTGTGCILITLLAELPEAHGVGIDVALEALALADANARRLGVGDRAAFLASDWCDAVTGEFDLILANPPYIASAEIAGLAREVSAYDPLLALDGGHDGLDAYRRIAAGAAGKLRPGGKILVEIAASQARDVAALLERRGFRVERDGIVPDLGGRPRVVVAGM
jgi:release factor glutamine methyltransferase